ncbi:MAG: hypothetical protein QOK24_2731 [Verrucomicrobiota bacterium]
MPAAVEARNTLPMKYPIKLILCVFAAWIPSYFVADYASALAVDCFMPGNPLIAQTGEMWVERSGLGLAREGDLPNVSPARARAAIFFWAGKWFFKHPVDALVGLTTFWWRWFAFGVAVVVGFRGARGGKPATALEREKSSPAVVQAPRVTT